MPSPVLWRALTCTAALAALTLVGACGGSSTPLSEPGDLPAKVKGLPVEVDVCDLVPAAAASQILDRPLVIVGTEYAAAQVPTLRCALGEEFGVSLVQVELATSPISRNVFEEAYGEAAGGDPVPVRRLGNGAFLRTEKDQQSLHVFVRGAILSLQLLVDPVEPVTVAQVLELATLALDGVPTNPVLAATASGRECSTVALSSATAAIGATPTFASQLTGPDGSFMCSWASSPGSAVVTTIVSLERVRTYRRHLEEIMYAKVPDIAAAPGVTVLSRTDVPGDLVIFDGRRAMATITVVPTAGFSDLDITTTPGERTLAESVIAQLP